MDGTYADGIESCGISPRSEPDRRLPTVSTPDGKYVQRNVPPGEADEEEVKYTLRLPASLYARLGRVAEANTRSINDQAKSFIGVGISRFEEAQNQS